jgi:hypothetical protein
VNGNRARGSTNEATVKEAREESSKKKQFVFYARPIVIWFSISFFSRNDLLPEAVLNPLNSHQQISSLNNSKQQQCS